MLIGVTGSLIILMETKGHGSAQEAHDLPTMFHWSILQLLALKPPKREINLYTWVERTLFGNTVTLSASVGSVCVHRPPIPHSLVRCIRFIPIPAFAMIPDSILLFFRHRIRCRLIPFPRLHRRATSSCPPSDIHDM